MYAIDSMKRRRGSSDYSDETDLSAALADDLISRLSARELLKPQNLVVLVPGMVVPMLMLTLFILEDTGGVMDQYGSQAWLLASGDSFYNSTTVCERSRPNEFVSQPANALSSVAWISVASLLSVLFTLDLDKLKDDVFDVNMVLRHPGWTIQLAMCCVFVGISSWLYHASNLTKFANLDSTAHLSLCVLFVILAWFRYISEVFLPSEEEVSETTTKRWGVLVFGVSVLITSGSVAAFHALETNSEWDPFMFVTLFGLFNLAVFLHYRKTRDVLESKWSVLVCAYSLGGVGLLFRYYDEATVLCKPDSFFQGHAIWQACGAFSALSTALFFRGDVYKAALEQMRIKNTVVPELVTSVPISPYFDDDPFRLAFNAARQNNSRPTTNPRSKRASIDRRSVEFPTDRYAARLERQRSDASMSVGGSSHAPSSPGGTAIETVDSSPMKAPIEDMSHLNPFAVQHEHSPPNVSDSSSVSGGDGDFATQIRRGSMMNGRSDLKLNAFAATPKTSAAGYGGDLEDNVENARAAAARQSNVSTISFANMTPAERHAAAASEERTPPSPIPEHSRIDRADSKDSAGTRFSSAEQSAVLGALSGSTRGSSNRSASRRRSIEVQRQSSGLLFDDREHLRQSKDDKEDRLNQLRESRKKLSEKRAALTTTRPYDASRPSRPSEPRPPKPRDKSS